jgi:hypothetical protein
MGWEVHRGAYRAVYLVGPWAVKVPRARAPGFWSWEALWRGMLANLRERWLWRSTRSPYLAPIVFADPLGLVVVMRRAERARTTRKRWRRFVRSFTAAHSRRPVEVEREGDALWWLDGRLVAVDYGGVPGL